MTHTPPYHKSLFHWLSSAYYFVSKPSVTRYAGDFVPSGETRNIAVQVRDSIENRMTPVQVAEAQKLAREWKTKAQAEN